MKKSIYHFREWTGTDASIEISIKEYGLLWKENKREKNDFFIAYGIPASWDDEKQEFSRFAWNEMRRKDFEWLIHESWFDLPAVLDYTGSTEAEFLADFPSSLADCISYHGTESILGSAYCEGFEIA